MQQKSGDAANQQAIQQGHSWEVHLPAQPPSSASTICTEPKASTSPSLLCPLACGPAKPLAWGAGPSTRLWVWLWVGPPVPSGRGCSADTWRMSDSRRSNSTCSCARRLAFSCLQGQAVGAHVSKRSQVCAGCLSPACCTKVLPCRASVRAVADTL